MRFHKGMRGGTLRGPVVPRAPTRVVAISLTPAMPRHCSAMLGTRSPGETPP
ncbi:hypothetical protein DPMN_096556 [Dreissena polymorpha]|uniref:Uncharacterized protein n=1 Tax=Dreissena polymorpha TaxID=45954 RepID=A0A9D4L8K2_DREPO|nr:hypothetical protein DPMN_096556 [Dreissena polymorpha]